ncbi:MAG: undecaprenyl/decaprenyl-phosphate alpha-N-acetylglucosaminyl 1-phosphate transferase [Chromatiales bacterium]|nr:undecaprenyl/decaprenyl-phosphate alpha-N-acetylglucosaminyl 1-phosphate transferase [Chromatiales bacterium]
MPASASALLTFVLSLALMRVLARVARRIGLTDDPRASKLHVRPVPLVGGLGILGAMTFGALTLEVGLTEYRPLFACASVIVLVGVLDDLRELTSRARFAAQILVGAMMTSWGAVVLWDLGAIGSPGVDLELGRFAIPFTVFAAVGVINALNMADGLDGLAGGHALVALLAMLGLAVLAGRAADAAVLGVSVAAVLGFLAVNLRWPGCDGARVYLGDAGSMLLGLVVAWFAVSLSQGDARAMPPVSGLWVVAVPLFDAVWLIGLRLAVGRSPTSGGLDHLHHVLLMAGLGVNRALAVMLALAVAGAAVGLATAVLGLDQRWPFWGFVAAFVGYCAVLGRAWRTQRLLGRPLDRRLRRAERRSGRERRAGARDGATDRRSGSDRRTARSP